MKSRRFLLPCAPAASLFLLLLPTPSRADIKPPTFHFPPTLDPPDLVKPRDIFYKSDTVNVTFTTPYLNNMIAMWCNNTGSKTTTVGKPRTADQADINDIRNYLEPDKTPTWVTIRMNDVFFPADNCWFLLQENGPQNKNPGVNSGHFAVRSDERTSTLVQPPGSTASTSSASGTGTGTGTSTSSATASPSDSGGASTGSHSDDGAKGLSTGAIAGIAVVVVVLVLAVGAFAFFRWRRGKGNGTAWVGEHRQIEKSSVEAKKPEEQAGQMFRRKPTELRGYETPELSGGQVTARH